MNIIVKTGGFAQEQTDVIAIGVLENPDFYSAPLQKHRTSSRWAHS